MNKNEDYNLNLAPDIEPSLSMGLIWLVAGIWLCVIAMIYAYAYAKPEAKLSAPTAMELKAFRESVGVGK